MWLEMTLTGEAKRAYQREWMRKRRQDWIDRQGGTCVACGSAEDLHVDHVDRATKLCEPAAIWSRAQAFRDAELAKCQVLCRTCHEAKTGRELSRLVHGTVTMYKNHGCRCAPCVKIASDHRQANRRQASVAQK